MKSGCYEFGFYGDLALRVDNELNVYEFIRYDDRSRLIKTRFISNPIAFLPNSLATIKVVPLPQNGSSTISPTHFCHNQILVHL